MGYRNQLCEGGFSFEYSATFGQAIKGDRELTAEYARSTLVDYSYRWFHRDGFGKDYRIVNMNEDAGEWRTRYLTAALLTFFQQQWIYGRHGSAFRPYNVEPPALGVRGKQGDEESVREGRVGRRGDPPLPGRLPVRKGRQR